MRVGLTGGIASGKSVASAELRRLGAYVIDYDQLAREVIAPGTPGAAVVADAFGVAVQGDDGVLDRSALARVAFASDDARLRLESIVHPLVYQAAAEREAELSVPLVVHDIPLLAEVMDPSLFDQIVVVEAPAELRLQRLVEGRGWDRAEAARRLDAQCSDEGDVTQQAGDINATYQQQYIDAYQAELVTVKRLADDRVDQATQILRAAGVM